MFSLCEQALNRVHTLRFQKSPLLENIPEREALAANNPFEGEVNYAKRILDGTQSDETVFSLLYEPENTDNWSFDDTILKHANPVALEIPEIWDDLLKKRARAISIESARENFLTKHCNIIYQGAETESFIDIKDLQRCRVNKIDYISKV